MTKQEIEKISEESKASYNKLILVGKNSDSLQTTVSLGTTLTVMLLCELWLKLEEGMDLEKERFDYIKTKDIENDEDKKERQERNKMLDALLIPYAEKGDKVMDQVLNPPPIPYFEFPHASDCKYRITGVREDCTCRAYPVPAKPNA